MKNIIHFLSTVVIGALILLTFTQCSDDFEDPNLDFSNTTPQYVDLASAELSASIDTTIEGGEVINADTGGPVENQVVSTSVRLRETRDNDVTVNYSVSGDISESASVVISVGELSANISVTIPFEESLNGSATLSLDNVDDGLTIGRANVDVDETSAAISWSSN